MATIQLPGAFHNFLQNVMEKSFFTIAYRNCNFKFINTKLFERIPFSIPTQKSSFSLGGRSQFLGGMGGNIGLKGEKTQFTWA